MSVKVQDNTGKIKLDIKRKSSLALRFMMDDIQDISEPKTPRDRGYLRRNVQAQVLGLTGKITWGQRYAVYQENKQFRNYTTAGTGPHFARDSVQQIAKNPRSAMKRAGLI